MLSFVHDEEKEQLLHQSASLIKKTEQAEEIFRKNFQNKINKFFNDSEKQMNEAFRDPSISVNKAKGLDKKYDTFSISSFEIRLKNNKFIETKLCDGVKDFRLGELFLDDLDEM